MSEGVMDVALLVVALLAAALVVREALPSCSTCKDTGWLCAGTDRPADFEHGTCCKPWESEFAAVLGGQGCPSANGCPDCDRSRVPA